MISRLLGSKSWRQFQGIVLYYHEQTDMPHWILTCLIWISYPSWTPFLWMESVFWTRNSIFWTLAIRIISAQCKPAQCVCLQTIAGEQSAVRAQQICQFTHLTHRGIPEEDRNSSETKKTAVKFYFGMACQFFRGITDNFEWFSFFILLFFYFLPS